MSLLGLQMTAQEAVRESNIHTKNHRRLLTNLNSVAQIKRSTHIKKRNTGKVHEHGIQHLSNLIALGDLDGSRPLSLSLTKKSNSSLSKFSKKS